MKKSCKQKPTLDQKRKKKEKKKLKEMQMKFLCIQKCDYGPMKTNETNN